jgi:hypothetical protein
LASGYLSIRPALSAGVVLRPGRKNAFTFSSCAMPPALSNLVPRRIFDAGSPSVQFFTQWTHPKDVFSVLLILGGDVVGRALAQLAGGWLTPVAFSFGT